MISPDERHSLAKLALDARADRGALQGWDEVVTRARAADSIARIERAVIDGALAVDTATDAAADAWPADYLEAFRRLGYDDTYGVDAEAGLYGLFHHLSDDQLQGLTSSLKGTVMEIRVREMAQAGEIPGSDGLPRDAHLSESLTQRGHDVEIVDAAGQIIEKVQVKAGDWSNFSGRVDAYVSQGVSVAVTSEAAQAAEAAGRSAQVMDTGISSEALTDQAAEIVGNLGFGHAVDELVPEIAVVMLAAAAGVRLRSGQSVSDVRRWVTSELQALGVANSAGLAVQVMTGMAVVRPIAALGARWTLARVRTAGEMTVGLRTLRERLREGSGRGS